MNSASTRFTHSLPEKGLKKTDRKRFVVGIGLMAILILTLKVVAAEPVSAELNTFEAEAKSEEAPSGEAASPVEANSGVSLGDPDNETPDQPPSAPASASGDAVAKAPGSGAPSAAAQPGTPGTAPKEGVIDLEKSLVKGRRGGRTESVAKMDMARIENPQVYNTVDSRTMSEQVVTRYDEALRNVPGLDKLWESTGRASGDGAAYYSLRGFSAQPNMTNGLPGLTLGNLDPANLDRVEVLKGPSATLFGSTNVSYGGLINNVTKQPGRGYFGEAGLAVGSFGLTRLTADANLPLSKEKDIALRINSAVHSENSFQDAGFRKSLFVAPSLAYQANERATFHLSGEYMTMESANNPMLFLNRSRKTDWETLDDLNYDPELSMNSNDLTIRNPRFNVQARMDLRLLPGWTSQSMVTRGIAQSDGYYSYLWNQGARTFQYLVSDQEAEITSTNVQQNLQGDFRLGSVRNRLLLGLDFFERTSVNNSSGWAWVHNVDPQGKIDYVNPRTGDTARKRPLSRHTVDSLLASLTPTASKTLSRTYGAYASEVLDLTPSISASASLRLDWFDTEGDIKNDKDDYDQLALSPRFGLVYQPIPGALSLFGSYLNGFKNIAPATVSDADGSNSRTKTFEPEQASQWEAGIKTSLFNHRLVSTLSSYYIRVTNTVIPDGSNPNDRIQGGEVESRGIEVDLNTEPLPGLSLIGGYSWNDAEVIAAAPNNIFSVPGRRPSGAGPEHSWNAWANYRLGSGPLRGLSLGAGLNGFTETLIMNSPLTGTFSLSGAVLLNAAVSYEVGGGTLSLAVNNLTDEVYYKGWSTINPQLPRNTTARFTYGF